MVEQTQSTKRPRITRRFTGVVISDKMDKTVVVKVISVKMHPKYRKRFQVSKKFHAHDPKNEYKINDQVVIEEIRPLAKTKKWRVISKINKSI
jgi:small subunit ribosomal protein S17